MTGSAIDLVIPVRTKKEIKKTVQEKLESSLADYKTIVGEKKFNARIKEIGKIFSAEVHKALPKKEKKLKKNKNEMQA